MASKYAKWTEIFTVVGLSFLTLCVVLVVGGAWLMAAFSPALSHIFDGGDTIPDGSPNYLRNVLEILSFFATGVLLPGAAIWAGIFARRQADEARKSRETAENIRLSEVYMEIVERWNSRRLFEARKLIFELVDQYNALEPEKKALFEAPQHYIRHCLLTVMADDRGKRAKYIILLQFFEDLGLLCYKNYIREDDIFDFIGSPIITQMEYLQEYIRAVRTAPDGRIVKSRYANAIYLYKAAKKFRPALHEEEMWPS